jgi:N-acetylglucosaminyldiphosphoundecaprenol N-acetyl-beta-D-mannosaminyltransferase
MHSASASTLAELNSPSRSQLARNGHSTSANAWPIAVLGIPFDHITIEETVRQVDSMIASRRSHYIVTANVDFLVQAQRDVELRRILLEADLILCDGTPVLWASRWLGNALPERVAGSDLAPALVRSAAEKGHRLFFLGAAPGVAADAEANLKRQYPQLRVVGTYAPAFSKLLEMDHDEIARRVRDARPDLLLVSFGCPKQEKWIAMHHRSLGVPVSIGVGATLDFLGGRVKRAPMWMARTGTEWLFRLLQEPKRLGRRYAADFLCFLPTLTQQWLRLAAGGESGTDPVEAETQSPDWSCIVTGTRLTRRSLEQDASFWQDARRRQKHCALDLSRTRRIDGTGLAFLIRWRKQLHAAGHQFVLLAPSAPLRRILSLMRVSDYFVIVKNLPEAMHHESLVAPALFRDDTIRILTWGGEIIAANTEEVWRMTTEHVGDFVAHGATLVIVDLTRLRFIDSSGAALMLRLKKWASPQQVDVLFAKAHPNVRNVLRLTHLDHLILEGSW